MKLVVLFSKLLGTEGQCHRWSDWKYLPVGGGFLVASLVVCKSYVHLRGQCMLCYHAVAG